MWDGDTAYCDAECQARWMNYLIDAETERQRIKAAELEAIEKAIAKFPGITDVIAHQNFKKRSSFISVSPVERKELHGPSEPTV